MYELIIIGGGPAGVSAGIYAGRKKIKTLLIAKEFGGQSKVSDKIENWIGVKSISGYDLAKSLEDHLRSQSGIEILEGSSVSKVSLLESGFLIETDKGEKFETRTVLVASGSSQKKLNVTGEEKFMGRGVAYCSTCDAPLFKDKSAAVVGSGNAACEAVLDLASYASKIYMLVRSGAAKCDAVTLEEIKKSPKIEIVFNAETLEILGDEFVSGLKYKDKLSAEEKEIKVEGVFVEIGWAPNSEIVEELVEINPMGQIVVDHKTLRASRAGIWAAGDVTDVLYHQNNIAVGDGIKALLDIHGHLSRPKEPGVLIN
jgi:alkyl hydroperoxide reductase subunit F